MSRQLKIILLVATTVTIMTGVLFALWSYTYSPHARASRLQKSLRAAVNSSLSNPALGAAPSPEVGQRQADNLIATWGVNAGNHVGMLVAVLSEASGSWTFRSWQHRRLAGDALDLNITEITNLIVGAVSSSDGKVVRRIAIVDATGLYQNNAGPTPLTDWWVASADALQNARMEVADLEAKASIAKSKADYAKGLGSPGTEVGPLLHEVATALYSLADGIKRLNLLLEEQLQMAQRTIEMTPAQAEQLRLEYAAPSSVDKSAPGAR